MSVTGPDGVEWVPVAEALERVPGLEYRTLQSWWARGDVRTQRVGRMVWVAWEDVMAREGVAFLAGRRQQARHAGDARSGWTHTEGVLHPR
ncbi:hypothetical protein [Actinomyces howellii]|uniref:Uncharacterized protein n=1 Tax=Actinomyces howellii TaxID=52771 RepID=A0A448HGQ2_9ACTO|nr:hypothetical protein [Actinomyces howellii]VEG28033.1 Uncharacterised protein [Actinomyces howellii]